MAASTLTTSASNGIALATGSQFGATRTQAKVVSGESGLKIGHNREHWLAIPSRLDDASVLLGDLVGVHPPLLFELLALFLGDFVLLGIF